jgi:hypothetical protein
VIFHHKYQPDGDFTRAALAAFPIRSERRPAVVNCRSHEVSRIFFTASVFLITCMAGRMDGEKSERGKNVRIMECVSSDHRNDSSAQ